MLCINTSKIKYSTVGASFTVTYSVAIDEIPTLMILHDKLAENNGKAYQLTDRKTETQYDAEEVAKDINRRAEMVKKEWNARHIEDEPQTDCAWK